MKSIQKFDELVEINSKVDNGELGFDSKEYREAFETVREMNWGERELFEVYSNQFENENDNLVIECDYEWSDEKIDSLDKALKNHEIDTIYCYGRFNFNVNFLVGMQKRGWTMNGSLQKAEIEKRGICPVIEMFNIDL